MGSKTGRMGALILAWGCAQNLLGQVTVRARAPHDRFVLYEPIPVQITVENGTGRDLQLGSGRDGGRLFVLVERVPGERLLPKPEARWPDLVVPARGTASAEVDVSKLYDIRSTGPYTLWPGVEWAGAFVGGPKLYIDVVPGFELDRREEEIGFGGTLRTLSLLTVPRGGAEHLLLKVEDLRRHLCFAVVALGPVLRAYGPQLETDAAGQVHVLHLAAPGQFLHTVLTADGDVVSQETYAAGRTSPRLRRSLDGAVAVEGERRPSPAEGAGGTAEAGGPPSPEPAASPEDGGLGEPVRQGRRAR